MVKDGRVAGRRLSETISATLLLMACLCAENIPLMVALVISAAIFMGIDSKTIQNLRIRKPPLMLKPSRAAKQNRRHKNNLSTAILAETKGKGNHDTTKLRGQSV